MRLSPVKIPDLSIRKDHSRHRREDRVLHEEDAADYWLSKGDSAKPDRCTGV
jgi:hypothetical protein